MHVFFVSNCQKRALKRSRALLDSYAVRTGPNCWATPITQEALEELHRALKRTATRQTSVACFINQGMRGMKLLWIVGSKNAFSDDGRFATGTTGQVRAHREVPTWVRAASLLALAAGKMHDIGKSSVLFAQKLRGERETMKADPVRHEWLSAKLLQAMRVNGRNWPAAWKTLPQDVKELTLAGRIIQGNHAPAACTAQEAIDLAILTHHSLLGPASRAVGMLPDTSLHVRPSVMQSDMQYQSAGTIDETIWNDYFHAEQRLEALTTDTPPTFWRALCWYARAALIFADHTVSAEKAREAAPAGALLANTYKNEQGQRIPNQTLDWHLATVGTRAAEVAYQMHHLRLPTLSLATVQTICQPSVGRFDWQNHAAAALAAIQHQQAQDPALYIPTLVLNTAGTGSGKTRMNVRSCCVLRPEAARVAIALNLRALTLQTGAAMRQGLGIDASELATVIGDHITQQLFEKNALSTDDDENPIEAEFICDGTEIELPAWLEPLFPPSAQKNRLVLTAPLLVSTIDYLIAAGEPGRQGHHVRAYLRLLSSDLVLDEIDSYDPQALVAVLRLVQLAASHGRNVVCSSATLPAPLLRSIVAAFNSGIRLRESLTGHTTGFYLAAIDDLLTPEVQQLCSHPEELSAILAWQRKRQTLLVQTLAQRPVYRKAQRIAVPEATTQAWTRAAVQACATMHQAQQWSVGNTGVSISIGLVRVANIPTAIALARTLCQGLGDDTIMVRVAAYHAGDFLINRAHKEKRLDRLLTRHHGNARIENDAEVQNMVASAQTAGKTSLALIVVATPVEEIGRDHDFDWAVVEPSSAHSIVQTAGRVNRHRLQPVSVANVGILQYNLRHCRNAENQRDKHCAFVYPGLEQIKVPTSVFEEPASTHLSHDLHELLAWGADGTLVVDARLRLDHGCSLLAQYDDLSLTMALAPFFGRQASEDSFLDQDNFAAQLIGQSIYDATPLRERLQQREFYFDTEEHGEPVLQERFLDSGDKKRVPRYTAAHPAAWLTLSPTEILQACDDANIRPEWGTVCSIACYSEADQGAEIAIDLSFGVQR